ASLASAGTAATATVAGSPYAITIGSALGSGLGNYNISYVNGSFAVTPANLTVTASNQTKVYGSTFTFNGTEFTTSGLKNSDAVTSASIASSGAAATATVAGSPYAITIGSALGSGLGNYNISYVNGSFAVTPANLTVTASNQTKVYGNTFTFNGNEFTTSGLLNTDSVTSASLASSGAAATATVAGSPYAITIGSALGSGLGNYNISYVNGSFAVTPANLTVTASNQSKTYGQTFTFNGTEFTTSGLKNSDAVTSASLASAGAAASATIAGSPYAITIGSAVGSGLSNYNISYVNGTLAITPYALTVTASNQTKVYGSTFTFNGTEFTTSGLLNGDSVTSASLSSSGSAVTATVAGSPYAITIGSAVGSGLNNYTITYVGGNLAVTPKALTVTASNQTKVYGQTFTFDGTEFSTSGLVNTDAVTSASLSSSGSAATATVAGSPYSIDISGATGSGLGNYTISYVNGNLAVTPKALTVTALDQSKVYGSTFTFDGTEFSTSGLVNTDAVTNASLSSSGAGATATVAGSPYSIDISGASGSGLGNYTISYVNGNLAVTPKALTVTALDQSKVYGSTFTFDGTEFSTSGLVNSDAVDSASLSSSGADASATVAGSPYNIDISGASGSGLGNYTITYVDGNLAVTPKALTVTALDQSKVYGSTFTFDGTEFSTSGLVNTDTVDTASLSSSGADASATVAGGPYNIDISGASGSGLDNYTITYVDGSLAVTTARLTVTAVDQSKVYGSTFAFDGTEFTTSGLLNSDAVTSASLSSAGSAATATVVGSPYTIDISGASGSGLDNYTISYVNGDLTVTPKALTIVANDQSKTAGQNFTFLGTEFTSDGLVNGDSVSSVLLASLGAPAPAPAGIYEITVDGAQGEGLSNYEIAYVPGTLTVDAAVVTPFVDIDPLGRPIISVADQVLVYNAPFENIEVATLDTDVSIKLTPGSGGEQGGTADALANLEPAAGGDDDANGKKKKKGKAIVGTTAQDLANVEPAAGGNSAGGVPAASGDVGCANDFLDNKPCAAQ
ncbi:MAG: MBG domain-containing protein, partial [Alphaproteobacteria bacterium]